MEERGGKKEENVETNYNEEKDSPDYEDLLLNTHQDNQNLEKLT